MGNLSRRVLVAVFGIPLVAVMVYAGGLALALFLGTMAAAGALELYRLARAADVQPVEVLGAPLAAVTPLLLHLAWTGWLAAPMALAGVLFVALVAALVWLRSPEERPIESIAVTVLGVLYCGATLAFAYALRHHRFVVGAAAGTALLFYPLVVTWGSDIGAYFVGRSLGTRKLMPRVSPGKTVEGAVGGLLLAMLLGVLYNTSVLRPYAQLALAPWTAIVFAAVVSVAAQAGDLAESLLKRQAGVKDSSHLLPGHGGILDRLDSLYVVLPVAYLMLGRFLLPAPR